MGFSSSLLDRINLWSPMQKRWVLIALDVLILPIALWAAFALRLEDPWPADVLRQNAWVFPLMLVLRVPTFLRVGLYHAVLKHSNVGLSKAAAVGVGASTAYLSTVVLMAEPASFPQTVLWIDALLCFLAVGLSRGAIREVLRGRFVRDHHREKVLIYGAGQVGARLAQVLHAGTPLQPVGFIDDNPIKHGTVVAGLKVHAPHALPRLIEQVGARQVLLALPSAGVARRREILAELKRLKAEVRSVPDLLDLVIGRAHVNELREVDALELLGREVVDPDEALIRRQVGGRAVLVTGAGGSIGSELCRQIAVRKPSRLVLFDSSEFALWKIHTELKERHPELDLVARLGTVVQQVELERSLREHAIEVVYHAAAYKHVPMVEENVLEGVRNNVLGTWSAASAAASARVETFVLISTDKAVRPTSVMGASKLLSEMIVAAKAEQVQRLRGKTRFVAVRFGNVLDSAGSVVPLFRRQIAQGGPLTVTHPDVERYFMTIPEAAQLVMQAGAMGRGGEVFLLEMGEPVKIMELARRMIALASSESDAQIEVQVTGLRPGEKLKEELLVDIENSQPTRHPKIFRTFESTLTERELRGALERLFAALNSDDETRVLLLMRRLTNCPAHTTRPSELVVTPPPGARVWASLEDGLPQEPLTVA